MFSQYYIALLGINFLKNVPKNDGRDVSYHFLRSLQFVCRVLHKYGDCIMSSVGQFHEAYIVDFLRIPDFGIESRSCFVRQSGFRVG